jgi:hypothetical protein
VKHSTDLVVEADSAAVIAVLADLSTYPSWNDLVTNAVPIEPHVDDPGPAWITTLRAQIGPLARSKQLRFVQAHLDTAASEKSVRFVRREIDERDHAEWIMEAVVIEAGGSSKVTPCSKVTLSLAYDGGLWVPALGGVLSGAIDRATSRLPTYLETR